MSSPLQSIMLQIAKHEVNIFSLCKQHQISDNAKYTPNLVSLIWY